MTLTFKVGLATFTINTNEIDEEKIEAFRNHIDLSVYVELEEEEVPEYLFELQDDDVPKKEVEEPEVKKTVTTKKKRKTSKK